MAREREKLPEKPPEKLPLLLRIHNATCPLWLLKLRALGKFEPGCRAVLKRRGQLK
jgi:hypothetical protein